MAQQPQIAVVVAAALLQWYAMVNLMACAYASAALTSEAIAAKYSLSCTHPLSAPDTLSCSGLGIKCIDPVLAQCWQCCVESL